MSRAHFRYIRRIMYSLKRRYPQEVQLYRSTGETVNYQTGVKTRTTIKHTIKRGVLLPQNMTRNFSYDLSFIAANKEFTYGGLFDTSTRQVIVSRRDIPTDWPLDLNSWLVMKHTRYELKEVREFEHNEVVVFVAKALTNAPPTEHHDVHVCDDLELSQTIEVTVE